MGPLTPRNRAGLAAGIFAISAVAALWRLGIGSAALFCIALLTLCFISVTRGGPRFRRARAAGVVGPQVWLSVLSASGFASSCVAMMSIARGSMGLQQVSEWLMYFGAAMGAMLIMVGFPRRVGSELYCAKCEYPYPDSSAPDVCPECGTFWMITLLKGRKVGSKPLMAAGVAVLLAVPVLTMPIRINLGFHRLLPTSMLSGYLSTGPLVSSAAWRDFTARSTTQEQRAWLAGRLIDLRDEDGPKSVESKQWLEAEMALPTAAPALLERYFAGMVVPELVMPKRVRVGEPFEVRLVTGVNGEGFLDQACFTFGGVLVGENSTPLGRTDVWNAPVHILETWAVGRSQVKVSITLDRPGRQTIKGDCWISVGPQSFEAITWSEAGEPQKPKGSRWFKRFELRGEVEVRP